MLQHIRVNWPSGVWEPAGLVVTAVEEDGVNLDIITNALIDISRRLGLDPVQDTVKEGPAGLIARLERRSDMEIVNRARMSAEERKAAETKKRLNGSHTLATAVEELLESAAPKPAVDPLAILAELDSDEYAATSEFDVGHVRALIYPSGRAFLSYLYDTPFFNALDELIQHGNLHIRGKQDQHRIRHLNLTLFTAFYQGALANLLGDFRVQNSMSLMLRQMIVLWPTDGFPRNRAGGRVYDEMERVYGVAQEGLQYLSRLGSPIIDLPRLSDRRIAAFLDLGVGIRYVHINRYQRLMRLALAVAFWRIADGDMRIEITRGDCAVADAILHSHDMGARLLEIAASRGRFGTEAMRIFIRLLDGESLSGESIAFASDVKSGEEALNRLHSMSIINGDGKLADQYRFVDGDVIRAHREKWEY